MDEAVKATDKLDGRMSSVSKGGMAKAVFTGNVLADVVQKIGQATIGFAKDSLAAFGKQEQFLTSLKTMFHGNAVEAEVLNSKLVEMAKTTPFELPELQEATKMMIAYGSTSTGVTDEMRMLGDVSSGVGSSLSEIGYLYGTLRTQGRAFSKDIYQFTGRGIPIVKELAKQFGVADSEVMKMVEDGKVGFKEVEKAFKSMTKEGGQFFGMMENQSKTLDGQISNMNDGFTQLKTNIGGLFSDLAKEIVSSMSTITNAINAGFNTIQSTQSRLKKGGDKGGYSPLSFGGMFDPRAVKQNLELAALNNSLSVQSTVADKSLKDAMNQRILVITQMQNLNKEFAKGNIGKEDFFKKLALMKGVESEIGAKIGIRQKDSIAAAADSAAASSGKKSGGTASSKLGTTAEISGAKPQSIVINITKLVESLNLSTTNLTESASKIKEEVAKALLEAVNDVNTLARTA